MGRRFDLSALAEEKPFVPPAFKERPAALVPEPHDDSEYRQIPVKAIALNPLNERPAGDDQEIEGLADTLREYGVIQPLLVCSVTAFLERYPKESGGLGNADWVVLIGNRRLRAARRAGVAEVPAIVNDERVSSMYRAMLIENLQHHAMPPLHEAEAMAKAMAEEKLTQRALADQIGKSQGFVSQRLTLLKLVPELRRALAAGELHIKLARTFGELPADEQRAIVAAGKPYRLQRAKPTPARSGWASSPARAATTITSKFTNPDELAELVRLLSERLESLRNGAPK